MTEEDSENAINNKEVDLKKLCRALIFSEDVFEEDVQDEMRDIVFAPKKEY